MTKRGKRPYLREQKPENGLCEVSCRECYRVPKLDPAGDFNADASFSNRLLALKAPQAAKGYLGIFITRLSAKHSTLLLPMTPNPRPYSTPAGAESAPAPPNGLQLYVTANADLNFAQMATALSVHGSSVKSAGARVPDGLKSAWINLVRQYEREGGDAIHEQGIGDAIPAISTVYFELQTQKPQGNFMQDMLASLMGGGSSNKPGQGQIAEGAGAAKERIQPLIIKQVPKPELRQTQTTQEGEKDVTAAAVEAPEEEDLD